MSNTLHIVHEVAEYYMDRFAGTRNVGGVADTVNDLAIGLIGAVVYSLVGLRLFLRHGGSEGPARGE